MRAIVLVLLLFGAACAQDETPAQSPETTRTPAVTEPARLEDASCGEQKGGDPNAAMLLTAVRAAGQSGFDRVVFEFKAREGMPALVPEWRVGPASKPLREDASGNEVTVEGSAFLGLTMRGSGVEMSGEQPKQVYTGPKSIKPTDTGTVREVRHAGDFEDTLTFYIGMSRAACFKARSFTDPVRIVVDVER